MRKILLLILALAVILYFGVAFASKEVKEVPEKLFLETTIYSGYIVTNSPA